MLLFCQVSAWQLHRYFLWETKKPVYTCPNSYIITFLPQLITGFLYDSMHFPLTLTKVCQLQHFGTGLKQAFTNCACKKVRQLKPLLSQNSGWRQNLRHEIKSRKCVITDNLYQMCPVFQTHRFATCFHSQKLFVFHMWFSMFGQGWVKHSLQLLGEIVCGTGWT